MPSLSLPALSQCYLHEHGRCIKGGRRPFIRPPRPVGFIGPGKDAEGESLALARVVGWVAQLQGRLVLLQLGEQRPEQAVDLGGPVCEGEALRLRWDGDG